MEKEYVVCLTGHRPKYLPWKYNEKLKSFIKFEKDLRLLFIYVINSGLKYFLTGMAEGFDMIATEILIKLRKKYKDIKIIAVVPCKNQSINWTPNQQKRYNKILKKCNNSIYISQSYTPTCMNDRNKYMVAHSSLIIACYNGRAGGTKNTINYAKKAGCKIQIINPEIYK